MSFSIPESTIEEIRSRTDLADLIAGYGVQVRRAGSSYKACCPFHHEKTPSFNIQPDKGFYHCFGCGESGDCFKFVQKQEGLSFVEAVKKLAAACGVVIEEKEDPQAGMRKRLYALHAELAAFYRRCLIKTKAAAKAREYLSSRDLPDDVCEKFQIGYAPASPEAMLEWAAKYYFKPEELEAAGVLLPPKYQSGRWYNRFADRLVFPIRDRSGRVVAFSCRTLETDKAKMRGGKYVNSPETLIFKKSNVLYGFDFAAPNIVKAPRREAIVCEGQIDVIRCHSAGFATALASQGTAFTAEHVKMVRKCADSVVLVFDADGAGRKAAVKTGAEFLAVEMPVRVATLPAGEDPDSLIRTKGAAAFQECLDAAESITSFQVRTMRAAEESPDSIDAVSRISKSVLAVIGKCPSAVMRAALLEEAAKLMGLPASAFERDLDEIRAANRALGPHTSSAPSTKNQAPLSSAAQIAESGDEGQIAELSSANPEVNSASSRENNLPGARETELCGLLMANCGNAAMRELIEVAASDRIFASPLTGEFVAAWTRGVTEDDDALVSLQKSISPRERSWFCGLINRVNSELDSVEHLRECLQQLWGDFLRRKQNSLPANDAASLGTWTRLQSLQRKCKLTKKFKLEAILPELLAELDH